jgi:hypothetical protein
MIRVLKRIRGDERKLKSGAKEEGKKERNSTNNNANDILDRQQEEMERLGDDPKPKDGNENGETTRSETTREEREHDTPRGGGNGGK